MALIDQQESAKLIRQNKDTHEDCQGAIHYNIGCEHSAQIVEQMKGQEIIYCKDCKYWKEKPLYTYCEKMYRMGILDVLDYATEENDFCSMAKRKGEAE